MGGIIMTVADNQSMIQNDEKRPIKRIIPINTKATFEQPPSTHADSSNLEGGWKNEPKVISVFVQNCIQRNNVVQTVGKSTTNKAQNLKDTDVNKTAQKQQEVLSAAKNQVLAEAKNENKNQIDRKDLAQAKVEKIAKLTESNLMRKQSGPKQPAKKQLPNSNNTGRTVVEQKIVKAVSPPQMYPRLQLPTQRLSSNATNLQAERKSQIAKLSSRKENIAVNVKPTAKNDSKIVQNKPIATKQVSNKDKKTISKQNVKSNRPVQAKPKVEQTQKKAETQKSNTDVRKKSEQLKRVQQLKKKVEKEDKKKLQVEARQIKSIYQV